MHVIPLTFRPTWTGPVVSSTGASLVRSQVGLATNGFPRDTRTKFSIFFDLSVCL
jgi:hypothetical protein